ncbi:MAG TPA: class I SAM-dependent methyltransferase [Anaerolineales bacterium]|nr:class I SAM-dependent methyltransferase [Anaerolineales bacterium]
MNSHFNLLAPFYDQVIQFSGLEKMLQVLELPHPGILLDAGGGTGRVASALRPYLGSVIVADVSPGMLQQARHKDLAATSAETEHLPFANNAFDRVLMVDALHHVVNQADTVHELYRVLRPGGRLVIEEPDLRAFAVKLIAVAEKAALMRSHFLDPTRIAAFFPSDAKVKIEAEGRSAWIIADRENSVIARSVMEIN